MIITLTNQSSQAEIDTMGARITLLDLAGHPILGTFTRGNGKPGITHPCSPLFGPETSTHYGLPQHGPVRDSEWHVSNQSESDLTLTCNIEKGTYPTGITISQRFMLDPTGFWLETTHQNNGSIPAPVNFAEHFYWHTPEGWENITLNGEPVEEAIQTTGTLPLKEENRLVIPGLPPITLMQVSLPIATLWTYHNSETGEYDKNYVCLEPSEAPQKSGYFGSPSSLLTPGRDNVTELRISI